MSLILSGSLAAALQRRVDCVCAPVNQSKIQQHILLEVAVQAELAFLTASSQEALLERVIPKQGERGAVCSVYTAHVCPG